jgi:outer membrane receptor protein involved in Fe transport
MPPYSKVDLRFNKDFRIWKLDYSFLVWVANLFDKKNVNSVYGASGRPDTGQNYFDEAYNANVVYEGREIEKNPLYYSAGRNIRLGLSVNF